MNEKKEVRKIEVGGKTYKIHFDFNAIRELHRAELWSFSKERMQENLSYRTILKKINTKEIQSKRKEIEKLYIVKDPKADTKAQKLQEEIQVLEDNAYEMLSEDEKGIYNALLAKQSTNVKEVVEDGLKALSIGLECYQPELTREDIAYLIESIIEEYGYSAVIQLSNDLIEEITDFFGLSPQKSENPVKKLLH